MKILVATDFSEGSRPVVNQALKIADKFDADLLLLHVLHDPAEAPGFYSAKKAGRKVLRNMEEAASQMMAEFVEKNLKKRKKIETRIIPGLPADQIVNLSKKEKVDMIVLGTHGRSGLKRLMLGSVTDRVLRENTCPVLVVHNPTSAKR